MPESFWRGKRVLVTGHTGFKGAWLSLWLRRLGAVLTGYALPPPTDPSLFQLARVSEGLTSVTGDVRDLEHLTNVLRAARPEVVFHLAAQALVRPSYDDPVGTFSTNVLGTVNILEAVRQVDGIRVVVNVTSDKCYENRGERRGLREEDPLGGHDPYSSSKACAEIVTASYRRSFFGASKAGTEPVAVASARAGNVIGGGDWAVDRLVPDCMRALMAGRPIRIRNPDAVRPWQFVLEPLGGYLRLAERLWSGGQEYAGAWNFGPAERDAAPVRRIADRMVEHWANGTSWVQEPGEHPHEAPYLRLDCAKARDRLGWSPRTDLDQALAWVVRWYTDYRSGRDMRDATIEQIGEFMEMGKTP